MLRNLNDWKIGEYENLLNTLSRVTLDGSNENTLLHLTTNGSFTSSLSISNCSNMKIIVLLSPSDRSERQKLHLVYRF